MITLGLAGCGGGGGNDSPTPPNPPNPPIVDTTPPSMPTGLTVNVTSPTQVAISWNPSTDNVGVTNYKVMRNNAQIASPAATSYTDTGLTPGTSYSYAVSAGDAAGNTSTVTVSITVTTSPNPDTTAPTVPTGLSTVVVSQTEIRLVWNPSTDPSTPGQSTSGVNGYRVWRNGVQVAIATGTSYQHTGLTAGTTYAFTVQSTDGAGNVSGQATSVNATTMPATDMTPPTIPSGLTATAMSQTQINLSWTASTDNVGVVGYRITRGGSFLANVTGTTYANTGLLPGTTYAYTVQATDAAGNVSGPSTSVSATTHPAGSAYRLEYVQCTPKAVYQTQLATTPITCTAYATGVGGHMEVQHFPVMIHQNLTGTPMVTHRMYDDGTHGDTTAGDNIFTSTFSTGVNGGGPLGLYDGSASYLTMGFQGFDGGGRPIFPTNAIIASLQLGVVMTGEAAGTTDITGTMRASERVVNIVRPNYNGNTDIPSLMQEFYRSYRDDYDFVVITEYRKTISDAGGPVSWRVKNTITGLGAQAGMAETFDRSAAYGSNGKLTEIADMKTSIDGLAFLHEIGHRWLAYFHDSRLNITGTRGWHFAHTTQVGQMGEGYYLEDIGGGQYRAGNYQGSGFFQNRKFAPLEQYFMCLRDKASVAPIRVYAGNGSLLRFGDIIPVSDTIEVTPDSLAVVYGPLSSNFATCQKNFKVAHIIVSDAFVDNVEHTFAEVIARYYTTSRTEGSFVGTFGVNPPSWTAATDGASTMSGTLADSRR